MRGPPPPCVPTPCKESTDDEMNVIVCAPNVVTVELMGGLGNQLFQIFTVMAYALRTSKYYYFEATGISIGHRKKTYWDTLLSNLKSHVHPPRSHVVVKEKGFRFQALETSEASVKFLGYFQSFKYFESQKEAIYKILDLDAKKLAVSTKIAIDYDSTVCLHVRIGDYIHFPNTHPIQTIDYYRVALEKLIVDTSKDSWKVLCVCEEADRVVVAEMVQQIKRVPLFSKLSFTIVESYIDDWEQLLMMSLCKHNIIANSTFSWWGAYLNAHSDKRVYYPAKWVGSAAKIETVDMTPPDWSIIHESEGPAPRTEIAQASKVYIVTGASQNHFKSLKQFISSVDLERHECYVWNLGLDAASIDELRTLKVHYRVFDFSKYPDYYNIHVNAGEYAWKPAIIKETMDELLEIQTPYKKLLFWCDSGNIIRERSLSEFSSHTLQNKLYSPTSSGNVQIWTHPNTLRWFSISNKHPVLLYTNRNGAQLGFAIEDPDIQRFIQRFDECARIRACIAPEGSSRANHRQDQAVFTILFYRFFQTNPGCSTKDTYFSDIHRDID